MIQKENSVSQVQGMVEYAKEFFRDIDSERIDQNIMLVINGIIHTMAGETIEHGFLRAVDGIITEIGSLENGAVRNKEENDVVWDLQGADVYPGFIDAHTHIGMWRMG